MRKLYTLGLLAGLAMWLFIIPAAAGGWFWNAQLDVEGTEVHLVWSVDDPDGANNYRANNGFSYPRGIDVTVVALLTENEKVYLTPSKKLATTDGGIEVQARFHIVSLNGANDKTVSVAITAGGQQIASAQGSVGDVLVLSGVVPTD